MNPDDRKHFFSLLLPLAEDEQQRSGIHPTITISQAAHESAWGCSQLALKAGNLFGITGDSWETEGKPVIRMPTTEWIHAKVNPDTKEIVPSHWITVTRPFRSYSSWAESVRDWSALLHFTRYHGALVAAQGGDLQGFGKGLKDGGYATDPQYYEALMSVGGVVVGFYEGVA